MICVIHFNPGTDKSRGHLGSQLERKAESNLRLEKTGETICIWSDKQRRSPIPRESGPCFRWDDAAGMHISAVTRQSLKETAERESLQSLAESVFAEHPALRRCDLEVTVKNRLKASESNAYRKVTRMLELAIISKSVAGLYTIANGARP